MKKRKHRFLANSTLKFDESFPLWCAQLLIIKSTSEEQWILLLTIPLVKACRLHQTSKDTGRQRQSYHRMLLTELGLIVVTL